MLSEKLFLLVLWGLIGYSIIIENNNFQIIYGHVSPNFVISFNSFISQNQKIGFVGPKYITDSKYNIFFDSTGKPTNGATTGPHLHLSIKKDGIAVNPLDYL